MENVLCIIFCFLGLKGLNTRETVEGNVKEKKMENFTNQN